MKQPSFLPSVSLVAAAPGGRKQPAIVGERVLQNTCGWRMPEVGTNEKQTGSF